MRLGGFVIFGNNRPTLGRCLDSLQAVADEVVAVDSQSTDGSAELVASRGLRSLNTAWRGYGAARVAATSMLQAFDYFFYLDSDEWLEADAVRLLREWKESSPSLPLYTVKRRNWVELSTRKFLFFTDRRGRLVRREFALWTEKMIVHEALPSLPNEATGAFVEHTFATSIEDRSAKDDRYALLWAVRMAAEGRTPKPVSVERAAHQFKYSVLYGGMIRGGLDGLRLAASVGRYHGRKHEFLRAIRVGGFPELAAAYASGEYERVMKMAEAEIREGR